MTRTALLLAATLGALAMAGPWIAPYAPQAQHRDFMHAPPMPPRVIDEGGLRAPFARPVVLADRLDQRYEVDEGRALPLPWGAPAGSDPVFLLGSDRLGRDVLSRVLHGARASLGLALVSTLGALLVGALLGAWAGYRGGWPDEVLMRVSEFVLVLPLVYVVLALRAVLPLVLPGTTVFLVMAGIFTLVAWPWAARGVRGIVAAERERDYVAAARAAGASPARVIWRHLLPACAGYLAVQATLLLPGFILAEATLSFIGLGFPDSLPSWGTMLAEAANVSSLARFPWTLAPAVAIFLVVLATNIAIERHGHTPLPIDRGTR
ncbi:MAG: ABC transporter permease [Vicinamibacterales bacterium]|nr:ABC transporter permease [Vicinamibacterales bacterium]